MKEPWSKAGSEPAIWDVLADPIVLSLMRADHVTRGDVLRAADQPRRHDEPRRLTA